MLTIDLDTTQIYNRKKILADESIITDDTIEFTMNKYYNHSVMKMKHIINRADGIFYVHMEVGTAKKIDSGMCKKFTKNAF